MSQEAESHPLHWEESIAQNDQLITALRNLTKLIDESLPSQVFSLSLLKSPVQPDPEGSGQHGLNQPADSEPLNGVSG